MNDRIVDTGGEGHRWRGNMLCYVAVDELAAYKIVTAGGTICIEEQQAPGMGAFSLFTDPEGPMMGLWKAAK